MVKTSTRGRRVRRGAFGAEEPPGPLVSFYWNQRATRLWDLSRNPLLTELRFEDFIHLHDLSDLRKGSSLRELIFGDALFRRSVFESLKPVAALNGLRSLDFNANGSTVAESNKPD